tara:strand:- start:70 stop:468 length:399 start_codon:yes stop_codon:yes gene_type:complete
MFKGKILLTITSLTLMYLIGSSSYHYGLKLLSYPQIRAMPKLTRAFSLETGSYLTKEERDEYKIYLMDQATETDFMFLSEWKLAKVFKNTLTQLEKKQNSESFGPIAQRLEQTTHNRLVGGSNPSRPTISKK